VRKAGGRCSSGSSGEAVREGLGLWEERAGLPGVGRSAKGAGFPQWQRWCRRPARRHGMRSQSWGAGAAARGGGDPRMVPGGLRSKAGAGGR